MSKYIQTTFDLAGREDFVKDMLSFELSQIGYDSFQQDGDKLLAYVESSMYSDEAVKSILTENEAQYGKLEWNSEPLEDKDWNEEWEKNYFQPILIAEKVVICSTFHKNVPQAEHKIIINPRMAFGTGHHQTTELMIRNMLGLDLKGKIVMDMGCGTAILAIMAAKLGAAKVDGIDVDEWAYENSKDNLELNGVQSVISVKQGDARDVVDEKEKYDVFLANINRNILTADIPSYAGSIKQGGYLLLSGFYKHDIPEILKVAEKHSFILLKSLEKDNWVSLCLNKS